MKLKVGNRVYLQKYDAVHILTFAKKMPEVFTSELFGAKKPISVISLDDGLKFDLFFESPDNVRWLMSQDWILNYRDYSKMSTRELKSRFKKLAKEHSSKLNEINSYDKKFREAHYQQISEDMSHSGHVLTSLRHLIDARKRRRQKRRAFQMV